MAADRPRVAAVLLAGGSGTRLGLGPGNNKVYLGIGGRPVLSWSLATLDAEPRVVTIVAVVRAGDERAMTAAVDACRPVTPLVVVEGGGTRAASERAAFAALAPAVEDGAIDVVVVHDGARPFLSAELLDRVILTAAIHGGAVPGIPPTAPVFGRDHDAVAVQVDAGALRRVQTPQGFAAAPLLGAYAEAGRTGFDGVDTAEVVERFTDLDVRVVHGDPDNIKVTTPDDLHRADRIAARRR